MLQQPPFGHWLRLRRKSLDLTRQALAERVGCSAATIRKLEAEERRPSAQIAGLLAEVLGVPEAERPLFLRFARGDLQAAPAEIIAPTPWRLPWTRARSNLPAPPTDIIGRDGELALISNYLLAASTRLVTLIGPPGIGKTRLSLEIGRELLVHFPDGVFFASLAPFDNPDLIAPTIVQALGFVEVKGLNQVERLKDGIGDKHLLLVLDNLEHLILPAALLVTDLLLACPHLKILTTSREALRVSGEWLYPVPALEFPAESQLQFGELDLSTKFPALRLFEERARAVQPGFALDRNNFETVSAICQRLDGLPLAIEMVSARVRLMSTQDLLERMSDSFTLALPADGMRVLPDRQKTLHNAISWSYNLLTEDEKRLFAYLSVFAGDFTLATAEQAFPPNLFQKPVTDLVASLLDKSLLQRTIDARGEPRFTMLVTIQQFALERLRVNGEEAATRDLHLSYFLDFAERADRKIHGPDQVEWIDRLEMEHENFRAALEWSVSRQETRNSLRLLTALDWSWWLRGRSKEVRDWYDKISVLPGINQSPALVARLLNQLGRQSWLFGDYFDARSVLEQSRAVWLALGVDGEQGLAEALNYFGAVAQSIGDDRTALSFFEQSFELCQKNGYQWEKALVMFNLAWIAAEQDQDAMAFSWCRQSLDLFHRLGDGWGIARSSQVLGRLFLKQGNNAEARYYFEQELQLSEALQFSAGTVSALTSLGILYRHQGDYDQAEQFFQKSLLISLEHDLKWDISHTMNEMGLLALQRDNYRLAGHWLIESYELAYSIGDEEINAYELLTGLACVAAGMQQPERAARLDGAAHAILDRIDEQYWPADLAEFNRHLCIARRQIGEEEFEALAAEGRLMAIEQGVAYALEDYPHRRGRPPRTVQLPGF